MSWSSVKLAEVATIERDGVDPSIIASGTEYLGLEHIESGGRILGSQTVKNGELASTKFRFGANHVLYGKLRPYLAKIALPDFDGVCSTDILPIRAGPRIDRTFLLHFLRQPSIVDFAASRTTGANLPRLSPKALAEFEIPLPPLEEQKRIAAILDQADSLRRLRQRAIDRLNTLGQAIFYEMFGDPGRNPMEWEKSKFGAVGTLARGISKHRPRNDSQLLGGKYPLIQTGDVANADGYIRDFQATYSDIGLRQSRLWSKGTLCITIAANIGKTAILDIDACFPDSVVGFTASDITTTEYVQYWLSFIQEKLEKEAPQSAQKNINLAILSELEIPLPSRDLQKKFSDLVREIDAQKRILKQHLNLLAVAFSSLQHRAFRGEL